MMPSIWRLTSSLSMSGAMNGYINVTWAGTPTAADGSMRSRSLFTATGTWTGTMMALSPAPLGGTAVPSDSALATTKGSVYGPKVTSGASPPRGNAVDLEFRNVVKSYGAQIVVKDLSFRVPAGRICVLVGPSGCGKTTTLKMVNRLIEPTSGQILVGGKDVMLEDPIDLRRGIGYVIQQVGLLPHMTVAQNIATVPRLLGWEANRIRERTDELVKLVGLDVARYRERYPSELSGGERQRVGVARALAADPPLMLMDEPFGAVDPIVRERLQNELLRLQDQLAKTIVFVTHDIDEAVKMGDLVAVMDVGGVLAQFGPPADILAHPASDFVARFVGADRGLKRLSLTRVADLELQPAPPDYEPQPGQPILQAQTTLKDALSMMLVADVSTGVVVDRDERIVGLLTYDQIASALRTSP
jgi:osmoprotectant transport system ATP-binding protein